MEYLKKENCLDQFLFASLCKMEEENCQIKEETFLSTSLSMEMVKISSFPFFWNGSMANYSVQHFVSCRRCVHVKSGSPVRGNTGNILHGLKS